MSDKENKTVSRQGEPRLEMMRPVKVASPGSTVEADMLEAYLNGAGIQVMRRPLESGGYMNVYMGFSAFGENLYVDEADAAWARELVTAFLGGDAAEPEGDAAELEGDAAEPEDGALEPENGASEPEDDRELQESQEMALRSKYGRRKRILKWFVLLCLAGFAVYIAVMLAQIIFVVGKVI